MKEFDTKASDEELVAIVENDSCAVDALQVLTGCTFGKGNLIFRDYGKQVYTFFQRPSPEAVRISVKWISPPETDEEKEMWRRYMNGDNASEVLDVVHSRKARKIKAIMNAKDEELFNIEKVHGETPEKARIFPSVICSACGEKVMEPRARVKDGKIVCIPCMKKER